MGQPALVQRAWRAGVIGVIALSLGACAEAAKGPSPAEVVRRYVGALQAGDFDKAMALRCADARIDPTQSESFLADVARLRTDAGGELRVYDVDEADTVRIGDSDGTPFEHELLLRLATKQGASSVLHVGTKTEGGQPKVCGWSVDESFAIREELATITPAAGSTPVPDVRGLVVAAAASSGGTVVDDQDTKGDDGSALEGWTSGWQTGNFGGGRATVLRYASSTEALRQAADVIARFAPDAGEMFQVTAMPDGMGLRYTGHAWTGVQPADLGLQIDLAIAVYDDTVVWLTASALDPSEDHSKVLALADAASAYVDA